LNSLMGLVEAADATPTTQAVATSDQMQRTLTGLLARWNDLKAREVTNLNDRLRQANLQALTP